MYRLGDERAAIREIQKYLHFISDRVTQAVPRIAIDGIFGDETREAVIQFQRYAGINEGGEVDFETFELLFKEYSNARLLYEAEDYFIDEMLFPFKKGDMGREILYINLMLDELGKIFPEIPRVDIKPYFSLSTENAVKEIRSIFMLETEPFVDIFLFDRMRYELKVRGKESNIR